MVGFCHRTQGSLACILLHVPTPYMDLYFINMCYLDPDTLGNARHEFIAESSRASQTPASTEHQYNSQFDHCTPCLSLVLQRSESTAGGPAPTAAAATRT